MSKEEKKVNRRDFLFTASYTVGAGPFLILPDKS